MELPIIRIYQDSDREKQAELTNYSIASNRYCRHSKQLCKHEDYAYTLNNDTKMCTVCFKTFV